MFSRLALVVGRSGRWVSPPGKAQAAFLGLGFVLVTAAGGLLWWLLGTAPPGTVLVEAYGVMKSPPELIKPQGVEWALSVEGGGGLQERSRALLTPSLPPLLCPVGEESSDNPLRTEIQTLARAVAAADIPSVRQTLDRLLEVPHQNGDPRAALAEYNLALGHVWADDHATAARILDHMDMSSESGGTVPVVGVAQAASSFGSRVEREDVVLAFHVRYLAGLVAQARRRPDEAIAHFRRALNAVNYVTSGDVQGGHYRRVAMKAGGWNCGVPQRELTSLDAYRGLVAAYLAAPDFRDPTRLPREVARRGYELDPEDPLEPVLRLAQEQARRGGSVTIPEHVVWASSNLQRVYHYNRLRPDPGLSLTRAVVTMRLVDQPDWRTALGLDNQKECAMLARVASDLYRDGNVVGKGGTEASQRDSAWAAVAVHTFARVESKCLGEPVREVDVDTRGRWLRLGGGYLHGGLVARYENLRSRLEAPGADAAAEVRAIMRTVASDLSYVRRGRIPPDLPASLDAGVAKTFIEEWQRSVFEDVVEQMLSQMSAGGTALRSREVRPYLRALEGAVTHAGLRPKSAYREDAVMSIARSQGTAVAVATKGRFNARSHPGAAAGVVGGVTAVILAVLAFAYVTWWRFHMIARMHPYQQETISRRARGLPGGREIDEGQGDGR